MEFIIEVPEDLGGKLRVFEPDVYRCAIQDMFIGESQGGNPKLTVKWVVQTEFSGKKSKDYISTIGENVLETYSLLPQALWNLNDLYQSITGEQLPAGGMPAEEFLNMLKSQLTGGELLLRLVVDESGATPRMQVEERMPVS